MPKAERRGAGAAWESWLAGEVAEGVGDVAARRRGRRFETRVGSRADTAWSTARWRSVAGGAGDDGFEVGGAVFAFAVGVCGSEFSAASGGNLRVNGAECGRLGLGVAVLPSSVGLVSTASSYGERRTRFLGGERAAGLVEATQRTSVVDSWQARHCTCSPCLGRLLLASA